jgi:photosystem II stability/assembly factor-like uncharacterized protein
MKNTYKLLCVILCIAVNADRLHSQWLQNSGPSWGETICLTASDTNLFVGTYRGVYVTRNNGKSWEALNRGMAYQQVNAIVSAGRNLFAATQFSGIFRSSDGGENWTAVNTGLGNTQVFALALTGSYLFAGTYGGVYRSADSGASWTAVNTGLTNQHIQSFAVCGQYIFTGTYGGGVFRSSTNGASWWPVNTGLTGHTISSMAVSGTKIFAGTNGEGIFLSTDSGVTWTAVNSGLTDTNVFSLAVSGDSLFAGTYDGVFRSVDNASSWTAVNAGITNKYIKAIALSGEHLFVASSSEIYHSTNDGGQWEQVNTNLIQATVTSLAISGTNIFAGTFSEGIYRTPDKGTTWFAANTGLTNSRIRALVPCGTNLFAGTEGGGVFRSSDNGTNWSAVNFGLSRTSINTLFAAGKNIYAGSDSGIFISMDNGTSWNEGNIGLKTSDGALPGVYAFAVSGQTLYAGTTAGVFRSSISGEQWSPVNSGIAIAGSPLSSVRTLAVQGGTIFAGTLSLSTYSGGVYRSADSGNTWTKMSNGLYNSGVLTLLARDSSLFVGTTGGVYLLAYHDTSWLGIGSGLTGGSHSALAASETDLFSGTSQGVWSRPLSELANPEAPVPISPADRSIDIPIESLDITWAASTQFLTYHLQVSLDSTFATTVYDHTASGIHSCSVTGLVKNKTYYWRINVRNEIGISPWSKTQSFTTIGFGTTLVTLATPLDGSVTTADAMKFVWRKCTAPVLVYELKMIAENYVTYVATPDTFYTFPVPSNLNAKTYSWEVRAKTDTGYGKYSDIWTFTKLAASVSDSGSAVNRIELVSPSNGGQIGGGDSIRFIWKNSPVPAASYILDLWGDQYYSLSLSDTTFVFALPGKTARIYSWRVRSKTDTGSYSGLWSFTKLPTGVLPIEQKPIQFALCNNYPNPFNPSTTFAFALPTASFVTLRIFDVMGRDVASVVNEVLPAGSYSRQWSADGLPSGVYFYSLHAGAFSATRKLILLR